SFYTLLFGFNRCTYSGVFTLPFDGGLLAPIATGCTVLTDNLTSASGLALSGSATQAFPIASSPSFQGLNFFSQGISIDLASFAISASNGFAISIGQ
ncbi:MAG: hypothetical protein IT456_22525, partial [Planctomycetes bacterium]|nr:hypothetical protein [Planctomycetota bacterium]